MLSLLSQGSWWIINKKFTQKFGIDATLLLSDLLSRYEYWLERDKLEDGFFFCVKEDIEADTTLSPYRQNEALKTLIEVGIIETKRKGVPAKIFYRINIECINGLVGILNDVK